MGQIIELTDTLANQIAAGEVVERPASVVKELVENAIDAHSTQIDVWIEEAGLQSIRVVDNGDGILPDDVATAFLRHATSKIHSQDDLFRIRTLGFRGEALPSIASVSEVTMETSTGEGQGRKIKLVGGIEKASEPSKLRQGTSITVANLFFNTPARLKHIKSTQTEVGKIADLMNRLALSHPNISFRLTNEGHELIRTVGNSDLKQTVANVYSVTTAKKMRQIEAHDLDFHMSGLVSLPEETRASKNYISIILNGRYIKNYRLNHAIVSGYGSKLMVGRYPIAVINVDTDPLLVDVNVHPTKMEVRLGKEEELFQLISGAIQKMLKNEVLIPDVNSSSVFKKKTYDTTDSEQISMDFSRRDDSSSDKLFYNAETSQFETIACEEPTEAVQLKDNPIIYEKSAVEDYQSIVAETGYKTNSERQEKGVEDSPTFPLLDYIGQMHGTYLLAQNENGLYIVDQHAAQERVKYEYFRHAIADVDLDQQGLLTPIILDFSMDTSLHVQERMDLIEDLGIHLERFGDNSYILREQPVWFPQEDTEEFIRDIVEEVVAHKSVTIASLLEHIAIQRSCKRSIKANHFLDDSQAKQLLEDLSQCDNPYNCPHGRPVLVNFSPKDMEKLFKRIQDPH